MSNEAIAGDPYDDCDGCQRLLVEKKRDADEIAELRSMLADALAIAEDWNHTAVHFSDNAVSSTGQGRLLDEQRLAGLRKKARL